LVHSLSNVIHGDTLTNPTHLNDEKNGLKKFDYIVSNPPFKMDFSETRDQLTDDKFKDRFFAGVPKIPNKEKDSMAIYLMFIQHIIYSLKSNGKAAIVVPTGFLTAKTGIENKIKKELVERKILSKVISMPSNIFANTGTNVSILFIDKSKTNEYVFLMDASKMGHSEKDGKNKRTVLSTEEISKISNMMINNEVNENMSVNVSGDIIASFNYDFSASLYSPLHYQKSNLNIDSIRTDVKNFNNNLSKNISKIYNEINQYLDIINRNVYIDRIIDFNDVTKLEIPDGWEKVKLGKIIQTYEKGKIPVKIYTSPKEGRCKYLVIESLNGSSNQYVSCNDGVSVNKEVVMVMDGAASGSVYQGYSGILGSTLAKLVISKDYNISNEFLYFILKNLESEIAKRNTGSTVPHANKIFIDNIEIAIPRDKKELNRINNYFIKIRKIMLESEDMLKNIIKENETIYLSIMNGQIKIED